MRSVVTIAFPKEEPTVVSPIPNAKVVSVVLGGLPGPPGKDAEGGGETSSNYVLLFENAIA